MVVKFLVTFPGGTWRIVKSVASAKVNIRRYAALRSADAKSIFKTREGKFSPDSRTPTVFPPASAKTPAPHPPRIQIGPRPWPGSHGPSVQEPIRNAAHIPTPVSEGFRLAHALPPSTPALVSPPLRVRLSGVSVSLQKQGTHGYQRPKAKEQSHRQPQVKHKPATLITLNASFS